MLTASVRGALLAGALLPLLVRADAPAAPPLLDEPAVAALALALSVSPLPELDVGVTTGGAAELELTATIEVAAVTFAEVPRIRVSLGALGPQRVRWRTERRNLPERVEPGVEYRDVTVKLALSGGPEQIQALLADARRIAAGIRVEEVVKVAETAADPPAAP